MKQINTEHINLLNWMQENTEILNKWYNNEMHHEEVITIFNNIKCRHYLIGNKGNGCFMDSCGHDCGCFTQETLEDAAERHKYGVPILNFIRGAEWQAKKMYSEDEVLELLRKSHFVQQNIDDWFEQFKKEIIMTRKEIMENPEALEILKDALGKGVVISGFELAEDSENNVIVIEEEEVKERRLSFIPYFGFAVMGMSGIDRYSDIPVRRTIRAKKVDFYRKYKPDPNAQPRNERCKCGSGKKHEYCCIKK